MQMEIFMKESGVKIKQMARENTFMQMVLDIKENGKMISNMVWV